MISGVNPELIIKTFGLSALQTSIYKGKITPTVEDEPLKTRFQNRTLSTPVFSDLQFDNIKLANGVEVTHIYPIETVLFSIQQSKNIVKTPINGRNGTIKEYVGMGDYSINIKGVIAGTRGRYPVEAVDNLMEFLTYNQSIKIYSKYLNERFNIDEIVILDFDLKQEEGRYSQQSFEINALSDYPVEILIQQQK
jgi:hypothetical protein